MDSVFKNAFKFRTRKTTFYSICDKFASIGEYQILEMVWFFSGFNLVNIAFFSFLFSFFDVSQQNLIFNIDSTLHFSEEKKLVYR